MTRSISLAVVAAILACAAGLNSARAAGVDACKPGQSCHCHMEQQCHWENFKKICVYVKVCR
ncbi:MAG TPA: hypothetical protein VEK73_00270 [Xanthobacteraceae bacterium]|nr:hypothetical protein [Xanthobacteraceae bacterium]